MIDKTIVVRIPADGMETVPVPFEWKMPEVRGVALGGCVKEGKRFRRVAHAHNRKGDELAGWICFLGKRRWVTATGKPSRIFWHEYAHILCAGHGHDDVWRAKMRELHQPVPDRYAKRQRNETRYGHVHEWEDFGPSQLNRGMTEYICSECKAWKLKRTA